MARNTPTIEGTRTPKTNVALDKIPERPTQLDSFVFNPRQSTSVRAMNSAIGVTAMTGADVVQVDGAAAKFDLSAIDAAIAEAERISPTVDTLRDQGLPPMEAAGILDAEGQKALEQKEFRDFVLDGALTVGDPNYSPAMARIQTNQQVMFEALENKFNETYSQGTGATVTDFLDRYLLRYLAFGMWEDLTRRSERRGADVMNAMASMTPAEFQQYAEDYATDLANEGVFKGTNWFALQEGMNEVTNAGYDPMATAMQAFALLDVVPFAVGATKVFGTVGRVALTRGTRAAEVATENLVKGGAHRIPQVQDELLPGQVSLGRDPNGGYTVGAPEQRAAQIMRENELAPKIQQMYREGSFGRLATQEEITAAGDIIKEEVRSFTSSPIVDSSAGDLTGFGDFAVSVVLGKADDGAVIATREAAEDLAQDYAQRGGFSASVIEAVPGDPSKGFYVEILENIPTAGLANAADISNVTENILIKTLGSARAVDLEVNTTLAQMGESGFVRFTEVVKPYVDSINKLSFESKQHLDSIWRELRDGEDAYLRNNYTESQFREKFSARAGRQPTDAEIDAFNAVVTISDAAWIMQANRMAMRYVERGFKSIELQPGATVPARVWGGPTANITVKNLETGAKVAGNRLPEGEVVWKLDRPWADGTEYVSRPMNVRAIQYEDVMPYNAGGRRIYDANYFGTLGDRAVLTGMTAKQMDNFVSEFGVIQRALRATGRTLDELTDELDGVIRANNSWNKNLTNTADLQKLVAKKGWDMDAEVSFKASGSKIENQSEDLFNGLSAREYYTLTQRRSDDVLVNYGGGQATEYSPIKAIVNQLSDAGSEYAYRAYNQRAKTAWLKKAMGADRLPKGADINQMFRDFDVKGNGATQRKLRTLKSIIERREQIKGPVAQALSDFGARVAEWVFDTFGKKISFDGLEGTLLGMGFQSAFGFFNTSQFFLQATHAFSIMAISPKHGSRAAGMVLPIRMAMHAPGKAREVAIQRLAKASGMSVDEINEYWTYLKQSGRDLVEADALEKGTGPGFGVSHWEGRNMLPSIVNKGIDATSKVGSRAMKLGTLPFNEGERLSRHTGILTAFLELKAKRPGVSALSDEGRAFIVRREQDLGFNMSTISRGAFQSGVMKVPTQWLGYSMRMMESVAVGKGLTGMERVRLAFSMALMGGTAGLGFGAAADYLGEKFGLDPEGNAFVGLKYGLPDAILSTALQEISGDDDIRTAFGTRIAPLTAFTDLYRKVTEESALAALGGPSGEIVGGGAQALLSAVGAVFNGNWQMAKADIERVLRTPSAIDNYWKAAQMMDYGLYQSKTGTTMPMEFSDNEAIMQALGITNFRVAEFYQRRTAAFRLSKDFKEVNKQLTTDFRRALAMYEQGDETGGLSLMREVEMEIQSSGFSPYDQQRLRRSLRADTTNDLSVMILDLIRRGNPYGTQVAEGLR